ncbi:3377_t:CDS:2, partial [Cetraspora pellucida]
LDNEDHLQPIKAEFSSNITGPFNVVSMECNMIEAIEAWGNRVQYYQTNGSTSLLSKAPINIFSQMMNDATSLNNIPTFTVSEHSNALEKLRYDIAEWIHENNGGWSKNTAITTRKEFVKDLAAALWYWLVNPLETLATNLSRYQESLQKQLITTTQNHLSFESVKKNNSFLTILQPNLIRKLHLISHYQSLVDFLEQTNFWKTINIELFLLNKPVLPQDIFNQIHHFPDPIPKKNDLYASLNNVYSNDTTEIYHPSLKDSKNSKKSQLRLKNSMSFNGTIQRAINISIIVMCSECERWRLFYFKQKLNEQEKKLLIAYLDTVDYYCGSSFCNADNLIDIQKQTSLQLEADIELESEFKLVANTELENASELVANAELESESELVTDTELESESELVANAELESESELVADAELESESELIADTKLENSETWENLFYQSNDINDKLMDDKDSDYYDELLSNKNDDDSNKSDESNKLINNEESDYYSETKSLSSLESLDTDKTTIKQLFEKVFINDGLTCNSPMEKAYYSAQIFSLVCFECGNTNISTPIPATQYPLCTECTQKGVKAPTHGKTLKFTTLNTSHFNDIIADITAYVPDDVDITPPPFNESHDLVTAVTLTYPLLSRTMRLRNRVETLVYAYYIGMLFANATSDQKSQMRRALTPHYYLTAIKIYDVFAPHSVRQIYGTSKVTFQDFRRMTNEEARQLVW